MREPRRFDVTRVTNQAVLRPYRPLPRNWVATFPEAIGARDMRPEVGFGGHPCDIRS